MRERPGYHAFYTTAADLVARTSKDRPGVSLAEKDSIVLTTTAGGRRLGRDLRRRRRRLGDPRPSPAPRDRDRHQGRLLTHAPSPRQRQQHPTGRDRRGLIQGRPVGLLRAAAATRGQTPGCDRLYRHPALQPACGITSVDHSLFVHMNVSIPRARVFQRLRKSPFEDAIGIAAVLLGAPPGSTLACLGRSHRSGSPEWSDGCLGTNRQSGSPR
jgi:hypothetical protein